MTKVRKQRRQKKYQYNVNRKRMNKKRLPELGRTIKKAWNSHKSSQKNFKQMGIVFDVNNDIKCRKNGTNSSNKVAEITDLKNTTVVKELQEDAKNVHEKQYKLPKHQVEYLIYLMEKYGDDYKAMSKDKKNYLQQTWKQLRSKISLFKRIPVQYNEYLNKKKLVT